jgi:hypothetical protein
MHRQYVEVLVAAEATALQEDVARGDLGPVEQRGRLLIVEFRHAIYPMNVVAGMAVPLLGQRREQPLIARLDCTNYDTDPVSIALVTDWAATEDLPFERWPKGRGIVDRHHETGRPFICRPGVREFHEHVQHGDEPWDLFRGNLRIRELVRSMADDLLRKQILAA